MRKRKEMNMKGTQYNLTSCLFLSPLLALTLFF